MTLTSILISIVILSLGILCSVVFFQVLSILSEIKKSVQKVNKIIDHTQVISQASAKPISAVNDFYANVRTMVNETQDSIISDIDDRQISQKPRYFQRAGLPIRGN